jgi:hypothetical protein
MAQTAALPRTRFGQTTRRDPWWVTPVVVFVILGSFVVYSTWAALQGTNYHFGNYLSPFYSPELFGASHHAWFGPRPGWWPGFIPFSPAILILWAPAGFRFTCYYYRGAYYKAFWADPPSCTVGEPRKRYLGERSFPLIVQNIHRYFLYLALLFLVVLAYDAWKAMWFVDDATGGAEFGIGVGTIVLTINVILLGGYTLGCHSLRHLIGGGLTQISKRPLRARGYQGVSLLNRRHMLFAWLSLFWVAFSDIYVRMLASGVWTDWRIL